MSRLNENEYLIEMSGRGRILGEGGKEGGGGG